jgi:hypothetical protein
MKSCRDTNSTTNIVVRGLKVRFLKEEIRYLLEITREPV